MFTPAQLVAPRHQIPLENDSKPEITSPPCLIMLGGLGDLLIILPVAYHYSQRFNAPTPVLTSPKYQNVLAGCSYVTSVGYGDGGWHGYSEAIQWAKKRFETVYPLHVGDPEIQANLRTAHFCDEQYLYAGVEGRYGEFPLIFDRRNEVRERSVVNRVRNGRPLFLYNIEGRSSPFEGADALLKSIASRWGGTIQLVNISKLSLSHFQDLLGLLDSSIGSLSIDTSTIHLMPASKTPYIALCNDTKGEWWSSVPRGNCVLKLGYTETISALPLINDVIADMLSGTLVKPVSQSVLKSFIGVNRATSTAKPHLVTIAHGEMEKVWSLAKRTWEPWLKSQGLTLETHTKLLRSDLYPSWNKIPIVLDALEKHESVWWVDSDITVARPTASLPENKADLLFATDWNGLCAAMFRAKATDWTRNFLRAALFLGDVRNQDEFGKGCGPKWEQNAFKALLRDFPSCSHHVAFMPKDFITDRPLESRNGVAAFNHFGAMPNARRIAAIRQKHNMR